MRQVNKRRGERCIPRAPPTWGSCPAVPFGRSAKRPSVLAFMGRITILLRHIIWHGTNGMADKVFGVGRRPGLMKVEGSCTGCRTGNGGKTSNS